MIADFITRLRYQWKRDLFKQTQNRLTLLYSGLIILFLMLFITIVYSLFYVLISNQEEDSIQNLADQELGVVKNFLKQYGRVNPRWGEAQNVIVIGEDQFFYYVVNPEGGLIMGDEVVGPLRPDLLNLLQGWMPEKNELRYETLRFQFENPWSNDERQPSEEREIRLLMTGRPIIYGNQFVGILYVGKNITRNVELFQWLLYLFIGLAIVFSGMAIYLSHILSKRTMVPIIRSYTRQRQFTADASHELRTPLSVLFSSVDALELEQDIEGKEKDSFSRKLLANMKDEIKRMTTLVGDLLTLARSDSDQPELLWQTFDFRLQVEKMIKSLAPLAEAKDIHICLHALPSLVVHGDEERLKQLLYILLDNAIKYTLHDGEVNVTLNLKSQEHRPQLTIQVQDTGIGISPEDQERIFDRFYQVDKARSRQMGGHGLGLSIAKWIVEAHGGSIRVFSKLGEGSTFIVIIPQPIRR